MKARPPIKDASVAAVFASYPAPVRDKVFAIRSLIFRTAANTNGVGTIEECLKWGEPAYLTSETGSGSTVRLAWSSKRPNQYGVYFNCQTTLVDSFRSWFPDLLTFEGNRAIVLDVLHAVPESQLELCIAAALTYHMNRARKQHSA